MKLFLKSLIALAFILAASVNIGDKVEAQSAYQSPVYIPSVAFTLGSFTSTVSTPTATNVYSVQNQDTMYIRIAGTFSGLSAIVQVTEASPSVTSPTWQTVPVRSFAEEAWITNISAAGFYAVQTEGVRQIRVLVNGVTISSPNNITFTASGNFGDRYAGNFKERKRTYSAFGSTVPVAAGATDVFALTGNTTTIVHVKEVTCYVYAGSATSGVLSVVKRSAADTGGTSSALTTVPMNSQSPSANVAIVGYTANPTSLGTSVGTVRQFPITVGTTAAASTLVDFTFGSADDDQDLYLNSATEVLAVNLNSLATTTGNANCMFKWTEN